MKLLSFLSLFATSIVSASRSRDNRIPLSLRWSPYAMLHDNSNYFSKRSGFRNIINPATLKDTTPVHISGSMVNAYAGIQDFFRRKGKPILPVLRLNEENIVKKPRTNFLPFIKNINF
ncbi:unnamed protein product [Oikopleura dioica]|uniref:Uncharacterized protein n=1 Tax=Oikopleura dioica TaxID=34765 RepID=E4XJV0_OIKDI|nr:unnamed protein product [Oikopleura dioica]